MNVSSELSEVSNEWSQSKRKKKKQHNFFLYWNQNCLIPLYEST